MTDQDFSWRIRVILTNYDVDTQVAAKQAFGHVVSAWNDYNEAKDGPRKASIAPETHREGTCYNCGKTLTLVCPACSGLSEQLRAEAKKGDPDHGEQ